MIVRFTSSSGKVVLVYQSFCSPLMNVHSSLNIPARMKVVNMTSNNGAMNTPSNPQNRHAKNRHNNVTSGGKPILFETILGSDNCRWMMMIMYSMLIKIVNVK